MRKEELLAYNEQLLETHKEHEYFFPGFFNGNHILFVGICPNTPTTKQYEQDMIAVKTHPKLYEEKLLKTPIGEYILNYTKHSKHISYTNLIKHATNEYKKVSDEEISHYVEILNKQILLLQPTLVVFLGQFVASKFGISKTLDFTKIQQTYYVQIPHHGSVMRQHLDDQLKTIRFNKVKLNAWLKKHAIVRVTNWNIYYRNLEYKKLSYKNEEKADFCFIKTDEHTGLKSFDGYNLKKVSRKQANPEDSYEHHLKKKDLFYYNNIDDIQHSKSIRLCAYDIETDFCNDALNTPKPVISICFWDSLSDKYYLLAYNPKAQRIASLGPGTKVKSFLREKEMLVFFFDILTQFDVITAWYGNHFDLPYLINRAKVLDIDTREFFEYALSFNDNKQLTVRMEPLVDFDARAYYQRLVYLNKPPNFSLDGVAGYLFGAHKVDLPMSIDQLWRKDINKLLEYNLMDVKLLKRICDHISMTAYPLSLQELVPQDFENAMYNSRTIENKLHHVYWKKKTYFPTKIQHIKKKFKGAAVVVPVEGQHKYVVVLDFAAMYTNIYRSFNISPDTLVGEKQYVLDNWPSIVNDLIARYPELNSKFSEFNTDMNACLEQWILIDNGAGQSYYFLPKDWKHGILPLLEEEMIALRKYYVSLRDQYEEGSAMYKIYDDLQGQAKAILNSIYGVTSYDKFILFSQEVSAAITAFAREMIEHVLEFATSKGFTPLYGDTDSIFLSFDKFETFEEVIEAAQKFENELNKDLDNYVLKFTKNEHTLKTHTNEIEYEKIYETLMLTKVKKRYFGYIRFYKGKIIKNPKLSVVGFETRQDSTPVFFKTVLENIYKMFLKKNWQQEVLNYLRTVKDEIKEQPIDTLIIKKKKAREFDEYTVTPQHITALKNSKTDIDRGEPVQMIYTKGKYDVMHYDTELGIDYEVDYDAYLEKFFIQKVNLINRKIASMMDNVAKNQTTLSDF